MQVCCLGAGGTQMFAGHGLLSAGIPHWRVIESWAQAPMQSGVRLLRAWLHPGFRAYLLSRWEGPCPASL